MPVIHKIEEIRRKPEHIRIRYVWACVAVSMVIIFSIWIFSISLLFQKDTTQQSNNNGGGIDDLKAQLQNIQKQSPSLKDYTNQSLNVGNEGINNNSGSQQDASSGFQYPLSGSNDSPQSSTYSGLPNSDTPNSAQQ